LYYYKGKRVCAKVGYNEKLWILSGRVRRGERRQFAVCKMARRGGVKEKVVGKTELEPGKWKREKKSRERSQSPSSPRATHHAVRGRGAGTERGGGGGGVQRNLKTPNFAVPANQMPAVGEEGA